MSEFKLNAEVVKKVLATVDAGLSKGLGVRRPGSMCVEAAVCYALGLSHSDDPKCVDQVVRSLKIQLNDLNWYSKTSRAKGMRKLAVLQLGTIDSSFDEVEFIKLLVMMIINVTLPEVLELDIKKRFTKEAEVCRNAKGLLEGKNAADAASYAADAASYAAKAAIAAASAANTAANAARLAAAAANYAAAAAAYATAAAYAAANAAASAANAAANAARLAAAAANARDEFLAKFCEGVCQILIHMGVPAVQFLYLLESNNETWKELLND